MNASHGKQICLKPSILPSFKQKKYFIPLLSWFSLIVFANIPANAASEILDVSQDNAQNLLSNNDRSEANLKPLDKTQPLLPDSRFERQLPQQLRNGISKPRLTSQDIKKMTQELEGLISRFESTLLTADAHESDISLSTSQVIENLLAQRAQNNKQSPQKLSKLANRYSHRALEKAKTKLDKFVELAKQGRYGQAQNQWLEAKRTLWDSYPTDRPVAPSEVRAMWLDRGTIVKSTLRS